MIPAVLAGSARWHLEHGDSRAVLATMPDACVDAVVCDPPYEIAFMGRAWDATGIAYDVGLWREVLRVVKPGGHVLAFGATRTFHRLASAIEDAGAEIRDCLAWMYSTGFPKSLDVSKAIDRQRDDVPEVRAVCRWVRARLDEHPTHTTKTIADVFGFHHRMVDHWAARNTDSQPCLPTWEQWTRLRELLGFGDELDAEVWRLNGRKGQPGEAWLSREVTGAHDAPAMPQQWNANYGIAANLTPKEKRDRPASEAAKRWHGWGTALRPGFEPVVVARRPLAGTVARNVLTYGTGAIHVEACRMPQANDVVDGDRWPPNVIFSHASECAETCAEGCPVRVLDEQREGASRHFPRFDAEPPFYLCPKASTSERERGLEHRKRRTVNDGRQARADNPRLRGETERANTHPTTKPIGIMRWLVRLVTPPGGIVLDPFAGSGTTLIAALAEGHRAIGIELDAEHVEIAKGRIIGDAPLLNASGGKHA